MQKRKVRIGGKEYILSYNMGVVIDTERETGKSFSIENLQGAGESAALMWCALKRYNDMGGSSMDEWAENLTFEEFGTLDRVMAELIKDFYTAPKEEQETAQEGDSDDTEKNG